MLRVREDDIQELGVVGAVHVDGDRRLELEVLAPAGGAGLADVEGLHLPIDGPSCSEMYRSAETSSFARDDVVGRRRGAASGVWGARRCYSLAAAGRNRGDESGVRLE